MNPGDLIRLSLRTVLGHPARSLVTGLGILIGVAAVVLLTSLGEGVHRFVLAEFTQFGTNLVAVTPGKTTTFGISGATISAVRPLSLADAQALGRLPQILAMVPVVHGNAAVELGRRKRRTTVLGVGSDVPKVWRMHVGAGRFLPPDDPQNPRGFAVLGAKLAEELFASRAPLGEPIRVGGDRFRVIGVMERKGQMLGFDLDDTIYLPVNRVLELFDRKSLMEVDLLSEPGADMEGIVRGIKRLLIARHGDEDFTIITQQQMLDVLDSVLNVLTLAVGALGSISLLVGGIGILSIMTIAVSERISEIGLLRALGAERRQVRQLFLCEALLLSGAGGIAGVIAGIVSVQALELLVPALPLHVSWFYLALAFGLSLFIGLLAGVLPALRAARLQPLAALRTE